MHFESIWALSNIAYHELHFRHAPSRNFIIKEFQVSISEQDVLASEMDHTPTFAGTDFRHHSVLVQASAGTNGVVRP
jgi:hypothetical protein